MSGYTYQQPYAVHLLQNSVGPIASQLLGASVQVLQQTYLCTCQGCQVPVVQESPVVPLLVQVNLVVVRSLGYPVDAQVQ